MVAALGHSWKQGLVGLGHRQELVLCEYLHLAVHLQAEIVWCLCASDAVEEIL